jgi:PTS system nitrogen regulatory IIA component
MKITEILTPEMIVAQLRGGTKPEVLTELAETLCKEHKEIAFDRLLGVLNERERLGSTAIGDGIAIPHGKLRGITKILGVFGRSPAGVDFESLDGNPTHLFFLLVAPEDSASLHLKALARVSRLFKDGSFRQRLLDAADGAELYRLLKEEDNKY